MLRVGQLDAELLDQELVHLLCEPLQKSLNLVNVCLRLHHYVFLTAGKTALRARFDSELTLVIQLTLYKFSLWNLGASYGARLQGLKYSTPNSPSGTISRTRMSSLLIWIVLIADVPNYSWRTASANPHYTWRTHHHRALSL